MSVSAIAVESLSKRYGSVSATSHDGLRHAIEQLVRAPFGLAPPSGPREGPDDDFWALRDVSFEVEQRRGRRHHRPQRRGQEHAAEDPQPDHRADRGRGRHPRPRRQPAGGRHRLPPGADRPREHLPQRRDPRHEPRARSRAKFDEIVAFAEVEQFLDTPVKRYSQRHVRAAGVRGRRAPRAGDPDRRRGARRRRRRVPAEVPRQDGRRRATRAARCCSSATTWRALEPVHARHRPGLRRESWPTPTFTAPSRST